MILYNNKSESQSEEKMRERERERKEGLLSFICVSFFLNIYDRLVYFDTIENYLK